MRLHRHAIPALLILGLAAAGCGDDGRAPSDAMPPTDAGPDDAAPDDATPEDAGEEDSGSEPTFCTNPGETLGQPCEGAADCSDGCFCNGIEVCVGGTCTASVPPCDDGIDCTEDLCDEATATCDNEPDDSACDDGNVCNGEEVCTSDLGCEPGLPLVCNDGSACTVDSCDPTTGCNSTIRDVDGDGFGDELCGGEDCNDAPGVGEAINPDAVEDCDNDVDDDCDGDADYADYDCARGSDSCDTLDMLPGPGTYTRSTVGLAEDHDLSCKRDGLDAVFGFSLPDPRDVTVQVYGGGEDAAVAVRPAADSAECAAGMDEACEVDRDGEPGAVVRNLPAGQWAIVVKTETPTTFTLVLELDSPTDVEPVDVCNSRTLDVSAGGTFTGSFDNVADDYDLACTSIGGEPEAAYRIVVPPGELKDVTATARKNGPLGRNLFVSLTRDCTRDSWDDEVQVACTGGSEPTVEARALSEGTYFLLVEPGYGSASGWELDVSVTDSTGDLAGDTCDSELDITDTTQTVALDSLVHDVDNACGPDSDVLGSRDAFFQFTLPDRRDVTLSTMADATHYVAISEDTCGDPSESIECLAGGGTVTREWLSLRPGTYHVQVVTTAGVGDLVATAVTSPAAPTPDNDTCADAELASPDTSISGTTVSANDDVASCGGGGAVDVFYRVELAEEKNVTAIVGRTDGSGGPIALGLRSSCTASGDLECAVASGEENAVVNRTLPAGTHYLVVESTEDEISPFSLRVLLTEP